MRVRFIPFAVIVLVLVSACDRSGSGGSGSGAPSPVPTAPVNTPRSGSLSGSVSVSHPGPPHATAPTVPADVPTTGPNLVRQGEQPPVMPLEATQHTQAGAVSFAKFFIHTIDWGFATMSNSYMDHYFQSTCSSCASLSAGIARARRLGHKYLGGRFSIRAGSAKAQSTGSRFEAEVTVDVTSFEEVTSKNVFFQGDAAHKGARFTLILDWRGSAWTADSLSVTV